jgi:hypothetical protein
MECPLVSPAALQSPWIDPVRPPHRISPFTRAASAVLVPAGRAWRQRPAGGPRQRSG